MADYSRRFKEGEYRYMTRARIENECLIIEQTERCDYPKLEYRSVIILPVKDARNMIKKLGLIPVKPTKKGD